MPPPNRPHLFPKIFYFFSALGYIFLPQFSPIYSPFLVCFCLFLECFRCIFTLILGCWSVGFAVLFLYGCLRANGKYRQIAILLLVWDASKNCIYIWLLWVIVGYYRLYSENKENVQKKENGTFCTALSLTIKTHVFLLSLFCCSGVFCFVVCLVVCLVNV